MSTARITHVLPGRIRIRISLPWSRKADALASRILNQAGVYAVEVNPLTGSILVHGERGAVTDSMLARFVVAPSREPRPSAMGTELALPARQPAPQPVLQKSAWKSRSVWTFTSWLLYEHRRELLLAGLALVGLPVRGIVVGATLLSIDTARYLRGRTLPSPTRVA